MSWLLWMLACAKQPAESLATPLEGPPEAAQAAAEPALEPVLLTEAQAQMHRALSVRDAPPPCSEVEALSDDPVNDWVFLAEKVEQPPWVSLRAAGCLTAGHGAEVDDVLVRWVTEPQWMGLGWAVLEQLDALEVTQARDLAETALTHGPDGEKARARIARCAHAEVVALVSEPQGQP